MRRDTTPSDPQQYFYGDALLASATDSSRVNALRTIFVLGTLVAIEINSGSFVDNLKIFWFRLFANFDTLIISLDLMLTG